MDLEYDKVVYNGLKEVDGRILADFNHVPFWLALGIFDQRVYLDDSDELLKIRRKGGKFEVVEKGGTITEQQVLHGL